MNKLFYSLLLPGLVLLGGLQRKHKKLIVICRNYPRSAS